MLAETEDREGSRAVAVGPGPSLFVAPEGLKDGCVSGSKFHPLEAVLRAVIPFGLLGIVLEERVDKRRTSNALFTGVADSEACRLHLQHLASSPFFYRN